jgi:riboflavin synthase
MFTGIIETIGQVESILEEGNNKHFTLSSPITEELKIDQSLSHNGVCLTVVKKEGGIYTVTAVKETLEKSNLGDLQAGDKVNLERCMPANGRFDGHIVQGHVDAKGAVASILPQDGSWLVKIVYPPQFSMMIVEKGSITVNGVSLTCFSVGENYFHVAIIPYTWEHTTFHLLRDGDQVNLEFDIIGKYVQKMLKSRMA